MVEIWHFLSYNLRVNVDFCIQPCAVFIKTAYGDTPQREEGT